MPELGGNILHAICSDCGGADVEFCRHGCYSCAKCRGCGREINWPCSVNFLKEIYLGLNEY